MTTRALEELDGGLGNCQASEDLSALDDHYPGQPQDNRTRVMPSLADSSVWPHDSQEPEAEGSPTGGVDARPKKTEKGPVAKMAPGPGKERLKAGATPRSPARKKAQAVPPPQPPPPPRALSEELPWGDLSLNKCLVLASLVALLGSAFQLFHDAVAGEADAPAPVPEPWVPPSSAPKEPALPLPTPVALAPPSGSPVPQMEAGEKTKVPGRAEAVEKEKGEPGEAAGKERAPLAHRGLKERPRKESPRKERRRKEERPRREETTQKAEKPRAAREPRGAQPRGWEAREEGRRPWVRDSRDPEHRKRQTWASPRRPDEEDWPLCRRKHRTGKGRD
ncbi:PREDICTED: junctional sarcoplasmic reticulum protein 1 [Hipposideros armiger]|uniref:Junctional sarcoplasmic reticulum protein 1 n=1 Tax=Hipposideros armiger TaxID=186990 RepID=A0A8B7SJH1_HIPAR|nr:PREDICTED: junctional sarcoplasmic reticulum protein 1 [Hipposideros armiger]